MHTIDSVDVAEALVRDDSVTGTARVTYLITVGGHERAFTVEAVVSGSASDAASALIGAGCDDARDWLRGQIGSPAVPARRRFGWRRVLPAVEGEPNASAQRGRVTATIEIGAAVHAFTGEVSTVGNPYRATGAAVSAARDDLWNWAWDNRDQRR